jgi:hypothetical protein
MMHFTGVMSATRAVAAGTSVEAALASSSSRRVTITLSADRYWTGKREAHSAAAFPTASGGSALAIPPYCSLLGRRLASFIEHLLRGHRHDLGVSGHEMAALDQLHKLRLDLARDELADPAMLVDISPLPDQVEMVGVGGIPA